MLQIPKIDCQNGYFPNNSTICVCYPGWMDDTSLNLTNSTSQVIKCSKMIDGFINNTNAVNNTNSNSTSNTSPINNSNNQYYNNTAVSGTDSSTTTLPLFYIIIIIVASILVFCCISCLLFVCYKRYKKQNKKVEYVYRKNSNNITEFVEREYTQTNVPTRMKNSHSGKLNQQNNEVVLDVDNNEQCSDLRRINRKLSFNTPVKSAKRGEMFSPNIKSIYSSANKLKRDNRYYLARSKTPEPLNRKSFIDYFTDDNTDYTNDVDNSNLSMSQIEDEYDYKNDFFHNRYNRRIRPSSKYLNFFNFRL